MRRKLLLLSVGALLTLAAGIALWPASSPAQPGKGSVAPAARPSDPRLPISRAVLYTSGVGYFQRDGEVEGTTAVELSFPMQDVNDLLKSMVLRDLNGGQVHAVGYDSYDPISKTLKNFAVNLSDNPSYAEVLNQARGEKVNVTWRPADRPATEVAGIVMGVEKQKQAVGKDVTVEVELLNLWSTDGMRRIKLSEIAQVRFTNSVLESEVKRALEVLAQGHDKQKKTVSLSFSGKGKRHVQVGYVVEHPIWKTSYRLVLSEQKEPFLQGWAMVENPTAEDWKDVRVQLVSGRPISFRMDLYQPLYVERPLVELELYAGLRPRAYEGGMLEELKKKVKEVEEFDKAKAPRLPVRVEALPGFGGLVIRKKDTSKMDDARKVAEDIGGSVLAAAQGEKLGEAFQYTVAQPLTLPRQKSAMLPIVNTGIAATRVSIYNENVQAAHPLLGLKLKNTTGLHLMQGPITVFDDGSYAGDAIIRDVQPKEERLLSYGIDQAVEVKAEAKKQPERLVKVQIVKGTLERTYTLRETKTYRIINRADKDRLVILEHPDRSPTYKLVTPATKPKSSRDFYRFGVKVPPGQPAEFPVVEEREELRQVALTNLDDDTVALLLQGPASDELKAAIRKAVELKNKLGATQRQLEQLKRRLATISEDQARQRENMKVIPQTDPVYKKYLDKFLAQESEIGRLRSEQEQMQVTAERQRQEYERHVMNLTVKE